MPRSAPSPPHLPFVARQRHSYAAPTRIQRSQNCPWSLQLRVHHQPGKLEPGFVTCATIPRPYQLTSSRLNSERQKPTHRWPYSNRTIAFPLNRFASRAIARFTSAKDFSCAPPHTWSSISRLISWIVSHWRGTSSKKKTPSISVTCTSAFQYHDNLFPVSAKAWNCCRRCRRDRPALFSIRVERLLKCGGIKLATEPLILLGEYLVLLGDHLSRLNTLASEFYKLRDPPRKLLQGRRAVHKQVSNMCHYT